MFDFICFEVMCHFQECFQQWQLTGGVQYQGPLDSTWSGVVFGWTWKVLWSLTRLFLANFCNLEMSGTLRCSERRIWLLIFFHPWNILLISTRVGVFKQFQRLFPTTG